MNTESKIVFDCPYRETCWIEKEETFLYADNNVTRYYTMQSCRFPFLEYKGSGDPLCVLRFAGLSEEEMLRGYKTMAEKFQIHRELKPWEKRLEKVKAIPEELGKWIKRGRWLDVV